VLRFNEPEQFREFVRFRGTKGVPKQRTIGGDGKNIRHPGLAVQLLYKIAGPIEHHRSFKLVLEFTAHQRPQKTRHA
jgi:hypothetical protein